jgi:hypothetical protein
MNPFPVSDPLCINCARVFSEHANGRCLAQQVGLAGDIAAPSVFQSVTTVVTMTHEAYAKLDVRVRALEAVRQAARSIMLATTEPFAPRCAALETALLAADALEESGWEMRGGLLNPKGNP